MELPNNKAHFIDILQSAFKDNLSVNYIVEQDQKNKNSIVGLMEYAYTSRERYGKIMSTEGGHDCALVLFPDQRKFSLRSMVLDLKLILGLLVSTRYLKYKIDLLKIFPYIKL